MVARRGGLKNYKYYKIAKKKMYESGFINYWQYKKMNVIQFIVSVMPGWLRKFVYFNMAHKKVKADDNKK